MSTVAEVPAPPRLSTWTRFRGWLTNPWGASASLVLFTWAHMIRARARPDRGAVLVQRLAPRTLWQGFSTRWYWETWSTRSGTTRPPQRVGPEPEAGDRGRPDRDADRRPARDRPGALERVGGREASNFLMLFPLVTPEIVMGAPLLLLFTHVFTFVGTGTTAQILGHATFPDLLRRRHRPGDACSRSGDSTRRRLPISALPPRSRSMRPPTASDARDRRLGGRRLRHLHRRLRHQPVAPRRW